MTISTITDAGISLKIENLAKQFGNHIVLHDLSLTINAGEFVTIVGRSGCGKTTLLRLIAGLEKLTNGQIFLDEQITTSLHPQIKIMFQNARLLLGKRYSTMCVWDYQKILAQKLWKCYTM